MFKKLASWLTESWIQTNIQTHSNWQQLCIMTIHQKDSNQALSLICHPQCNARTPNMISVLADVLLWALISEYYLLWSSGSVCLAGWQLLFCCCCLFYSLRTQKRLRSFCFNNDKRAVTTTDIPGGNKQDLIVCIWSRSVLKVEPMKPLPV